MMFMTLLVKEMRLRLRRERTVWLLISYIVLLGFLSWIYISANSNTSSSSGNWSSIGPNLYTLLAIIQMLLIIFITPAFTATSINGEKERQTFDLLLCSRLSSSTLIIGKLLAGLLNSLLLIAASIPIFSLVFFFGGISPQQAALGLLVFILTAILTASLGICCSSLISRPAVSTAVTYMLLLLWLGLPLLIAIVYPGSVVTTSGNTTTPSIPYYMLWHPIIAIMNTFSNISIFGGQYSVGFSQLDSWQAYCLLNCIGTLILVAISIWSVKPHTWSRLKQRITKQNRPAHSLKTKTPVTA
jgi:ABC-type transport system involved in multi-copper enzyme maturation permease subunit